MRSFLVISMFLLISCSPAPKTTDHIDDDYVLIEFASKLEEDYHRINDVPKESNNPKKDHLHHPQ